MNEAEKASRDLIKRYEEHEEELSDAYNKAASAMRNLVQLSEKYKIPVTLPYSGHNMPNIENFPLSDDEYIYSDDDVLEALIEDDNMPLDGARELMRSVNKVFGTDYIRYADLWDASRC